MGCTELHMVVSTWRRTDDVAGIDFAATGGHANVIQNESHAKWVWPNEPVGRNEPEK
jgi:hypothetical protein